MGSSIEASVLDALEQAEMAARERRLAASTEADHMVSAARVRAAAISAGADRRVDDALDELRRTTAAAAAAAIEDLELEAARRASASPVQEDPSVEQAVAMVVAHVLGETTPAAGDREPD